ncbi:MAG: YlbF family regulator [Verrucomicrobiota bacterium]
MSFLEDNSAVMVKTRELCETIVSDGEFGQLQKKVEAFFGNDEAREMLKRVQDWGQELGQKQGAGLQLSETEVEQFEAARTELLENEVASQFMDAQQALQTLQTVVGRYVGLTMELGRMPTAEDFAAAEEGCCGGGGGGGCGCQ